MLAYKYQSKLKSLKTNSKDKNELYKHSRTLYTLYYIYLSILHFFFFFQVEFYTHREDSNWPALHKYIHIYIYVYAFE